MTKEERLILNKAKAKVLSTYPEGKITNGKVVLIALKKYLGGKYGINKPGKRILQKD